MTTPAKILVVVIFILSLGFAAMSSILFASRENFEEKYSTLKEVHEQDVSALKKKNGDLQTQLIKTRLQRNEHMAQARTMELRNRDLEDEVKRKATELADKQGQINDLSGSLKSMMAQHERWMAQLDTLKKREEELRNEVLAQKAKIQEMDQKNQDLRTAKVGLEKNLENTKVELAAVQETADRQTKILDILWDRLVDARPIIANMPMPRITGKVLFVDQKDNIVVINVGESQKVKKNFEFTVYRGSEFIGKIRIIDLQDGDMAAGRIILQRKAIQRGDSVATLVGPTS